MNDPTPLRYHLTPGLLMHDWGDSSAVVFVPGNASTHLIDGDAAAVIAAWMAVPPGLPDVTDAAAALFEAAPDAQAARAHFQAQVPSLLNAGILMARSSD